MNSLLMVIGIAAVASGLLFMGQGAGYIQWPSESFMISQSRWIYYGAGIAAAGLLMIFLARR